MTSTSGRATDTPTTTIVSSRPSVVARDGPECACVFARANCVALQEDVGVRMGSEHRRLGTETCEQCRRGGKPGIRRRCECEHVNVTRQMSDGGDQLIDKVGVWEHVAQHDHPVTGVKLDIS